MATFRFNFSDDHNDKSSEDAPDKKQNIQWFESSEIIPSNQIKDLDVIASYGKMFVCGNIEIGHVPISKTTSKLEEKEFKNVLKLAEKEHSDLVAGIYEGGLKIWECTSDLLSYFEENKNDISFDNKQVLDLGCGAGILGIYACLRKAAKVIFQDYNREVIEYATIPNVLLNIEEEEREKEIKRCKFYCGDWESFNNTCHDKFDIIITSETIYNENNYKKLLMLFLDKLTSDGLVLVAAKSYYFGVGGGTRQFEQIIKENGALHIEVCWKSSGGIQREILKITRKKLTIT